MPASNKAPTGAETLGVDTTITLNINGSQQTIRACAARPGLPPILIVQSGPGSPLLNEVKRLQRGLALEKDFHVYYWDQRGTGRASTRDARSVSVKQQVDDVRAVLRWIYDQTQQRILILGISIGGTFALQAAALEPTRVKSVVAISPDSDNAASDASVHTFLHQQAGLPENRGLSAKVAKLGLPPYTTAASLLARARMLADLGTIESGKKFTAIMKETLFSMLGAYGPIGTVKSLRNLNTIQDVILPELASFNLFNNPLRLAMPVHYLFGEEDVLVPRALAERIPLAITAPAQTVAFVSKAGHFVQFDQPEIVRAVIMKARNAP